MKNIFKRRRCKTQESVMRDMALVFCRSQRALPVCSSRDPSVGWKLCSPEVMACNVNVMQRLASRCGGGVGCKNSCLPSASEVCTGSRPGGNLTRASSPPTLSFAYTQKDSAVEVETNSCGKLMFWG